MVNSMLSKYCGVLGTTVKEFGVIMIHNTNVVALSRGNAQRVWNMIQNAFDGYATKEVLEVISPLTKEKMLVHVEDSKIFFDDKEFPCQGVAEVIGYTCNHNFDNFKDIKVSQLYGSRIIRIFKDSIATFIIGSSRLTLPNSVSDADAWNFIESARYDRTDVTLRELESLPDSVVDNCSTAKELVESIKHIL